MTDGPSGHRFASDAFIEKLNAFGAAPDRVTLSHALAADKPLLGVLIEIVPTPAPSSTVEDWVVAYPMFAAAFRELLRMVIDDPWTFSLTSHERDDNAAEFTVSLDGSNIVASFLDHES